MTEVLAPASFEQQVGVALDLTQPWLDGAGATFAAEVTAASSHITGVYAVDPKTLDFDYGNVTRLLEISDETRDMNPKDIKALGVDRVYFPAYTPWLRQAEALNDLGVGVAIEIPPNADRSLMRISMGMLLTVMSNAPSAVVLDGGTVPNSPHVLPRISEEIEMLHGVHWSAQHGAILPPFGVRVAPDIAFPEVFTHNLSGLKVCADLARARRRTAEDLVSTSRSKAVNGDLPLNGRRIAWIAQLPKLDLQTTARDPEEAARLIDAEADAPLTVSEWPTPVVSKSISEIFGTVQASVRV